MIATFISVFFRRWGVVVESTRAEDNHFMQCIKALEFNHRTTELSLTHHVRPRIQLIC